MVIPLPVVTIPMILSPGIGWQHPAKWIGHAGQQPFNRQRVGGMLAAPQFGQQARTCFLFLVSRKRPGR